MKLANVRNAALALALTVLSTNAFAAKATLTDGFNCNEGLIQGQIFINAMDQHALASDLVVDGKTIELAKVQIFKSDDSELTIQAPGFLMKTVIPTHAKGQVIIGARQGFARIAGRKVSVMCTVPELADLN